MSDNKPREADVLFPVSGSTFVSEQVRMIEKSFYDAALADSQEEIEDLKLKLERYVAEYKDHADDWKRIQDAERRAEKAEAEVSLAKQDRDSWKSNWKISQDAANGLIESLLAENAAFRLALVGFSDFCIQPECTCFACSTLTKFPKREGE